MTDPDPKREEKARAFWLGKIATFQPDPKKPTRYAGQIIRVNLVEPWGPGKVPNFHLTVRGRSGKTANVDLCEQKADIFETWQEALADTETTPSK